MKVLNMIACSLVVLSMDLAWGGSDQAAPTFPPKATTDPSGKPAGKIAAVVNGELIYESDLVAELPDDAFQDRIEAMKKTKLMRLVDEAIQTQFIKDRKITISQDELNDAVTEFEQMVKTPGCPCCGGGFESLEQFMKINAYTMSELRKRVGFEVGMKRYEERVTKERTTPQALEEAVKKYRAKVEANYLDAHVISFSSFRDPTYLGNEKSVEAKKEKLAGSALQRLKKGDPFDKVAREMSEDEASAPKGGAMGCIPVNLLGPEVEDAFRKLEPNAYSNLVRAPWGYYILMRKKLNEEEILSVVKELAVNSAYEQVHQELKVARDRASIQYGSPSASAPASPSPGDKK